MSTSIPPRLWPFSLTQPLGLKLLGKWLQCGLRAAAEPGVLLAGGALHKCLTATAHLSPATQKEAGQLCCRHQHYVHFLAWLVLLRCKALRGPPLGEPKPRFSPSLKEWRCPSCASDWLGIVAVPQGCGAHLPRARGLVPVLLEPVFCFLELQLRYRALRLWRSEEEPP